MKFLRFTLFTFLLFFAFLSSNAQEDFFRDKDYRACVQKSWKLIKPDGSIDVLRKNKSYFVSYINKNTLEIYKNENAYRKGNLLGISTIGAFQHKPNYYISRSKPTNNNWILISTYSSGSYWSKTYQKGNEYKTINSSGATSTLKFH